MTFGFSRDDIGGFLPDYLDKKILPVDPFQVLDRDSVGVLVKTGIEKGRSTKPDLKVGICGEHGGEPNSVEFCHLVGHELRQLLALPRAHRPAGGCAGADQPPAQVTTHRLRINDPRSSERGSSCGPCRRFPDGTEKPTLEHSNRGVRHRFPHLKPQLRYCVPGTFCVSRVSDLRNHSLVEQCSGQAFDDLAHPLKTSSLVRWWDEMTLFVKSSYGSRASSITNLDQLTSAAAATASTCERWHPRSARTT